MRYNFSDKWPQKIELSGFTMVPNILIAHQADLGITSSEFAIIVGLLMHGWTKGSSRPSVGTLSRYNGQADKTIRAHLLEIENKGLIKRHFQDGAPSVYDFDPMTFRLETYPQFRFSPAQKQAPPYSKSSRQPYSEISTKEEAIKKTEIKRRNGRSGKPTAIGDILHSKGWP